MCVMKAYREGIEEPNFSFMRDRQCAKIPRFNMFLHTVEPDKDKPPFEVFQKLGRVRKPLILKFVHLYIGGKFQ